MDQQLGTGISQRTADRALGRHAAEQPAITELLNLDFGGYGSPTKVGYAAAGRSSSDFWNGVSGGTAAYSLSNLKWSDQAACSAVLTVLNGASAWGNNLPDPMFRNYIYSSSAGNITVSLSGLPSGTCDIYLYGHSLTTNDNAIFELWSDDVNWGIKGTSLVGTGPSAAAWEPGQQYVLFKDVAVVEGKPLVIHSKHDSYGYNNLCGMQLAYTGPLDTDADELPDGWEQRHFGNLDATASADADADGLSNLREYQLGTDPGRADTDANSISDLNDLERVWLEDATPQGAYQFASGDSWNWVGSWQDGIGWGGSTVLPHSGRWWTTALMHMSACVPNALHQHYFQSSIPTLRPAAGDVLYAYVNLDPTYPPSEVMLQWQVVEDNGSGSWEHRAYWGANTINWGTDGTASRKYMGALPSAGNWVRLEVPASLVGLEGKIVEGMAFTLWGGRAAWDSAGTINPDHDGDGLPDWWEIEHFGNLLEIASGDYDDDGLSNLQEYNAASDPNTISFRVQFESLYLSSDYATGTAIALRGHPASIAVLVDPITLNDAAWVTFVPGFTAALGPSDGTRHVWVGAKGRAAASVPTWLGFDVTRDTIPPAMFLTNPITTTVSQPITQVQGYSLEPLRSVRYDLQNALGSITDEEGYITSQWFDTTVAGFTTNWFECLDVPLAEGANTLTLRVTDRAGNTTTNTQVYTLDYSGDHTPPVLTLYWPQSGTSVEGDVFTLRAFIDDPTATVTAQITDSQGTRQVSGQVERNGLVWLDRLPLVPGTSTLLLTMTDAAQNSSTVSLSVTRTTIGLTINDLSAHDLNQQRIDVTGTGPAAGYKIWVNGVEAILAGTSWTANVPVNSGGTAVIQVRAIPVSDNGGYGAGGSGGSVSTMQNPGNPTSSLAADIEASEEKGAFVVAFHYDKTLQDRYSELDEPFFSHEWNEDIWWEPAKAGHNNADECWGAGLIYDYLWQDHTWGGSGTGSTVSGFSGECSSKENASPPEPYDVPIDWAGESCAVADVRWGTDGFHPYCESRVRSAQTRYELHTGGKAFFYRKNLFVLSASATGVGNYFYPEWDANPDDYAIDRTAITLGALGSLQADGKLYKALNDHVVCDITPTVTGNPYYTFPPPAPVKYKPSIFLGGANITDQWVEALVGERITLGGALVSSPPGTPPPPIDTYLWTIDGNRIADMYVSTDQYQRTGHPVALTDLNHDSVAYAWVDGGSVLKASCRITVRGEEVEGKTTFAVKKPTARLVARIDFPVQVMDNNELAFGGYKLAGIVFSAENKDTDGDWNYVHFGHQLFRYHDAVTGLWWRKDATGIDGPEGKTPYPGPDRDRPSTGLPVDFLTTIAEGSFTAYLAFRPTPNDILVPIRCISWTWNGTAVYSGDQWTLQSGTRQVDPADRPAPPTLQWADAIRRVLDLPPVQE